MSTPAEQPGALWQSLITQLAAQVPATRHDDLAALLDPTTDPTHEPDSDTPAHQRPACAATALLEEADTILADVEASWEPVDPHADRVDQVVTVDDLHAPARKPGLLIWKFSELEDPVPEPQGYPAWLQDRERAAYDQEQERDRDMRAESDGPIAAAPAGVPGAIMISPIGWKPGWKVEGAGCRVDILPPTDQRATYIIDPCSAFFTPEAARIYARLMLLGVTFIELLQQDASHESQ